MPPRPQFMSHGQYLNYMYVCNIIHFFFPVESYYKWRLGLQMYVYAINYQNYRDLKNLVQILGLKQWS